jgi:hypothetical protein
MLHTRSAALTPATLLLAACFTAAGVQPDVKSEPKVNPKADPALNHPSLTPDSRPVPPSKDQPAPVAPKPERAPQTTLPTVPDAAPNLGTDVPPLSTGKFLPEGTFITGRSGSLFLSDAGDAIFVPRGDHAAALAPVMLLPCQRLEQMLAAREVNGAETTFAVSGQVFTYRDREFLLPTLFAVEQKQTETPAAPKGTPEAKPKEAAAAPMNEADPRVADLIRDLEQSRSGPKKISPAAARPATGDAAAKPKSDVEVVKARGLSNEGTLLTNKRGRLVRMNTEGGRLCLVMDNDPNSPGAAPLILQPCRVMQQMESMSSFKGDGVAFRVSGRVMVFNGKNYLLPTFFQIPPKSDINSRQ